MKPSDAQPAGRIAEPLPDPSPAAGRYLGDQLALMTRFAEHLADTGVSHGLVGPREVPRIWDRHILNCAVVTDLIGPDLHVADVGSGAGLPGLVIAIARPDLQVTLIEPLLRRVTWLDHVRDDLDLENVTVLRSRAEQCELDVDVVTSRAVARLDVLAGWSLPLLRAGGQMLALKGSSAREEVAEAEETIAALGGRDIDVIDCGIGLADPPTAVVRVHLPERVERRATGGKAKGTSTRSAARRKRKLKQRRER